MSGLPVSTVLSWLTRGSFETKISLESYEPLYFFLMRNHTNPRKIRINRRKLLNSRVVWRLYLGSQFFVTRYLTRNLQCPQNSLHTLNFQIVFCHVWIVNRWIQTLLLLCLTHQKWLLIRQRKGLRIITQAYCLSSPPHVHQF